ncbi:transporter [Gramella lutea]|uniref:Transporter n=1 Tax=Christiangramia lutea TaxID=1607951 RepID=A0A9X1V4A6_9FLAO|nr:transporter [Christiangramia lutea]MCH4823878.1 transporter [Christiangramia lutea]
MMNVLQNIKNMGILVLIFFSFQFLAAEDLKDSIPTSPESLHNYEAYFCDACGCASSGGSMGFSTVGDQNFFGTRYIYQQYRSRSGIFNDSPWIDEHFNTLQLWGNIPISEKIKVSAILPFHFHNRDFPDGSAQEISGLGDISVIAFYNLIAPYVDGFLPEQQKALKHSLDAGLGVKMPTGNYKRENNAGSVNPGFQAGTGSWDLIAAASYTMSYNSWGANLNANYTWKTENDQQYEFGDQTNYGLLFYRNFSWVAMEKVVPVSILPFGGIAGEIYAENRNFGQPVQETAGDILFGKLGFEAGYGKLSVGANLMLPITQNLNKGAIEASHRIGFQLNYSL